MNVMKDLIIVGAGPIGLYAATLAGMRHINTLVLESLPTLGGQLSSFYPEKKIYDIPGFSEIRADEFVDRLQTQLRQYSSHTSILNNARVNTLSSIPNGFQIETFDGQSFECRTVLLTSGAGSLFPRRLEAQIDLDGIDYQIRSLESYRNKSVAVLGGGDSALDYCLQLTSISNRVHLIHRRDTIRGLDGTFSSIMGKVNLHMPSNIVSIIKKDHQFLIELNTPSKPLNEFVQVDYLLVAYGFMADTVALSTWDIALEKGKIVVDRMMRTSRPQVWASGNNVHYEGKSHTIACGFGEAIQAMESILKYLKPGKTVPYSSNLK